MANPQGPGNGCSGRNGTATISGSTTVGELTKWTFNPKCSNPSYASNRTQGYKQRVVGIKDASGRLEVKLDPTAPFTVYMDVGTFIALALTTVAGQTLSLEAIVDSYTLTVDIDTGEVIGAQVDYSSSGAWTNMNTLATLPSPPLMGPLHPEGEMPAHETPLHTAAEASSGSGAPAGQPILPGSAAPPPGAMAGQPHHAAAAWAGAPAHPQAQPSSQDAVILSLAQAVQSISRQVADLQQAVLTMREHQAA
jgi:hypothetical protein